VTHGTLGATLSREVRAGAAGTRGAPGAVLHREAGAGAQVTHDGPVAVLSREAGTIPPPPLPHRLTAPAPLSRRCRTDSAAAARSGHRPDHTATTPIGLQLCQSATAPSSVTSTTITTTSTSATSTSKGYHLYVVLIGFCFSHSISVITTLQLRGCQFIGSYL
jgi:hypothetical protein